MQSFDAASQSTLATSLRDTLGCHEPACMLTLRFSAASIDVTAVMTIPDASAGGADAVASTAATVAAVEAAANNLVAQPTSAISSTLGVSVEVIAPVTVGRAVVPLVVAPPPPSLSPPPSLPPLPPLPYVPDRYAVSGPTGSDDQHSLIAIAAGASAALLTLFALFYRWRRKANGEALRE